MDSFGPTVEWISQADTDPVTCIATQLHLLEAVGSGRRAPTLCVYSFRDDYAALGRFHIAPMGAARDLHRRITGGRLLPMGRGYAGIALVLPRRDAFTDGVPGTLTAAQVMNRHVRGFLKGCRAVGIDPIYPGRDVVTVDKRIVASLGLETVESGAAVFEMVVAVSRAYDELPALLDRADPDGVAMTKLLSATEVTHLEREAGRSIGFEELGVIVRSGFREQLGADVITGGLTAEDQTDIELRKEEVSDTGKWISRRSLSPELTYRGSSIAQSGAIEVYFSERDELLDRVIVSGDFIARSRTVEALEAGLRGCSRDSEELDRAIGEALAGRDDYLLGIGPASTIRDAIVRAEPW